MAFDGNQPILVSACLTGLPARYDGGEIANKELLRLLEGRAWVPVCPEQLGGLPIPRPPNSIVGPGNPDPDELDPADGYAVLKGRAKVMDPEGERTAEFVKGAQAVYALARIMGAKTALFRKNSPSCGSILGTGSDGGARPIGVAAALLMERGAEGFRGGRPGSQPRGGGVSEPLRIIFPGREAG